MIERQAAALRTLHACGNKGATLQHPGWVDSVAIANSRLLALDDKTATFKCKDYRSKGPDDPKR